MNNYRTFDELAEFARQRAVRSAKRQGHQEWAYWVEIARWAERMGGADPRCLFNSLKDDFERINAQACPQEKADVYALLVHLRKMLRNRGEAVPPLSLQWLRDASE